jgi:hypothetical protein
MTLDLSKVVPSSQLAGDSEQDTMLLQKMLIEAETYLSSFEWCGDIEESYFGIGVGGVVAVFLFKIRTTRDEVDDWIWVIGGDLPPAYISIENAPNPACALDGYIKAMAEWVEAVKSGKPVSLLMPMNVPSTTDWANELQTRLEYLDREILSYYRNDLVDY